MDRIIVGSSNVYRFYRPELYKDFKTYNVARCTDIVTFKAVMDNLEEEESGVIVSVLENFLDRSIEKGGGNEAVLINLGETIATFVGIIKAAAIRFPTTRFSIADPIKRPKNPQYQNHFEDIIQSVGDAVAFAKRDNMTRIDAIAEGCQQFESDQVHLTAASGQIFIEGLLSKSEAFFSAPIVNLTNDDEEMTTEDKSITDQLTERLDRLEGQVKSRRNEDNVIFARIREEMDSATNRQKEDKIVITGITSKVYLPADPAQRKVWLREIIEEVIKSVAPDFAGQIVFVNQGRTNGKIIPLVEVKLDSVENANMIRKAFAEKKNPEQTWADSLLLIVSTLQHMSGLIFLRLWLGRSPIKIWQHTQSLLSRARSCKSGQRTEATPLRPGPSHSLMLLLNTGTFSNSLNWQTHIAEQAIISSGRWISSFWC